VWMKAYPHLRQSLTAVRKRSHEHITPEYWS